MEAIKTLLDSDTDTTIIYQGGSGGFFLYYLLLLSEKYVSGETDIQQSNDIVSTVKQKILEQFPNSLKDNRSQWKVKEFWPNNNSIKNQSFSKKKLFLICNPLFNEGSILDNLKISIGTRKVLLYTDLDIQLRMAYEKNAYWFTEISRKKFNAPTTNYAYLKQIKLNYKIFREKKVDPKVSDIVTLYNPNILIDLKELIEYSNFNSDQKEFVHYWTSLQSNKIKQCLQIL
jgi:hypothetical protein